MGSTVTATNQNCMLLLNKTSYDVDIQLSIEEFGISIVMSSWFLVCSGHGNEVKFMGNNLQAKSPIIMKTHDSMYLVYYIGMHNMYINTRKIYIHASIHPHTFIHNNLILT